jgi:hypothetical protein
MRTSLDLVTDLEEVFFQKSNRELLAGLKRRGRKLSRDPRHWKIRQEKIKEKS